MTIDFTPEEAKALRLAAHETLWKYEDEKFEGRYDGEVAALPSALEKLEAQEMMV